MKIWSNSKLFIWTFGPLYFCWWKTRWRRREKLYSICWQFSLSPSVPSSSEVYWTNWSSHISHFSPDYHVLLINLLLNFFAVIPFFFFPPLSPSPPPFFYNIHKRLQPHYLHTKVIRKPQILGLGKNFTRIQRLRDIFWQQLHVIQMPQIHHWE